LPANRRPSAAWSIRVLSNLERCQRKAAECDEFARRMRDPAARQIFERAAGRWRRMADDSEDRLPRLVRLLAPRLATDYGGIS
jgi:hypothetical protein